MKSSYLTNGVLLLLIIGLYWFNKQAPPFDHELKPLTTLAQNDIRNITILRANTSNIIIEKIGSGWQLTQPLQATANTTRIELLLSLLNTTSYAQLKNNTTPEQFGLSPSKINLKFNEQLFQFGDIESISKRRYILYNDVIHLVEDNVMPLLNANASSFIENRLLATGTMIQKLSLPLRNEDNTLSNERIIIENIDGHWQSDSTAHTADQLTTLVDAWQHAYALQVLPITRTIQQNPSPTKIKIWFKQQSITTELMLQLNDKALYIIDPKRQLKYQFTNTIAKQLFPTKIIMP